MATILFIDTETGGLDPQKHRLLAVGVCVWSDNGVNSFQEEYAVWTDEAGLTCTPEALSINKIDLAEHVRDALSEKEVVSALCLIARMLAPVGEKCVIGGHNIHFDIGFLKAMFERCGEKWSDYFSHRALDTASILQFLSVTNMYLGKTSLDAALEYYKIPLDQGERHGALADAKYTAILFDRLLSEVSR